MNSQQEETSFNLDSTKDGTFENPLEKIEKLLTCSICLDRFKHPKLLPCHHTFCLHCLESYADIVLRNLKCPECRAEYPIPIEGVKSLPTNLTLIAFLDIHLEATEDSADQIEAYIKRYNKERCKICDEKAELELCPHCDRKTCSECKTSHMDMLRRDLGRLLGQVRRLSNRVADAVTGVTKGVEQLETNGETTKNEIREYFDRYRSDLRRREEHFLSEVDTFIQTESRLMRTLRDTLDVEAMNLVEACSWLDEILTGKKPANDEEFARIKKIFVESLEFLRNFQPDSDELFTKKLRFTPGDDSAKLSIAISVFGELTVSMPQFSNRYLPLEQHYLPTPIRMGLESDHYKVSKRVELEQQQQQPMSNFRYTLNKSSEKDNGPPPRYNRRQYLESEKWEAKLKSPNENSRAETLRADSPPLSDNNHLSPWRNNIQGTSQSASPRTPTPTEMSIMSQLSTRLDHLDKHQNQDNKNNPIQTTSETKLVQRPGLEKNKTIVESNNNKLLAMDKNSDKNSEPSSNKHKSVTEASSSKSTSNDGKMVNTKISQNISPNLAGNKENTTSAASKTGIECKNVHKGTHQDSTVVDNKNKEKTVLKNPQTISTNASEKTEAVASTNPRQSPPKVKSSASSTAQNKTIASSKPPIGNTAKLIPAKQNSKEILRTKNSSLLNQKDEIKVWRSVCTCTILPTNCDALSVQSEQ